MIDTKKVRLMSRISAYENGPGKKDLHINQCRCSTYVSIKVIESLFFITIAFLCGVALYSMRYISTILKDGILTMKKPLIYIGILYVIVFVLGWILSALFYRKKYKQARHRVIQYDQNLRNLNNYLKEDPEEASLQNTEDKAYESE